MSAADIITFSGLLSGGERLDRVNGLVVREYEMPLLWRNWVLTVLVITTLDGVKTTLKILKIFTYSYFDTFTLIFLPFFLTDITWIYTLLK